MSESIEKIKEYWDERGKINKYIPAATTNDVYLRELEIMTLVERISELKLKANSKVLDIGSGDGYTTIGFAKKLTNLKFEGIDYTENMLANAESRLDKIPELKKRNNKRHALSR